MKSNFPYEHVLNYNTQEVWVKCTSFITAMGLKELGEMFYPGYKMKIGTLEYLDQLRNQLMK